MRVIHPADHRTCYRCGERADVVVARGHDLRYCCWDCSYSLLEHGGVIVAGELGKSRPRPP
ncbi:hypothetical protein C5B90_05050 [Haloferax sp. Atlit-12N]|uniref:hypothetical protein n=1 Tax=Haloferax TaxID=2251 RepID=UPI000737C071|nr:MULTISPECIES: hypothetical protein [unclassified Haloferax]MCO8265694.1 hypothetical protein [Haloferax sp. AB510]RDZ65724.1 hypothetical protein C5B90_05050 [Haloferax sp. Atlit-12N]